MSERSPLLRRIENAAKVVGTYVNKLLPPEKSGDNLTKEARSLFILLSEAKLQTPTRAFLKDEEIVLFNPSERKGVAHPRGTILRANFTIHFQNFQNQADQRSYYQWLVVFLENDKVRAFIPQGFQSPYTNNDDFTFRIDREALFPTSSEEIGFSVQEVSVPDSFKVDGLLNHLYEDLHKQAQSSVSKMEIITTGQPSTQKSSEKVPLLKRLQPALDPI